MQLKYFTPKEFECKCSKCGLGYENMDAALLLKIDRARELAGIPFKVNSAVRCEDHNAKVGGKPDSAHIGGFAIDVAAIDSHTRFKIMKALFDVGFKRIGINPRFIHVDVDDDKPQEVLFLY